MAFYFANVTSWSPNVEAYVTSQRRTETVLAVVEHHLAGGTRGAARRRMRQAGRRTFITQAAQLATGGTRGGVLLGARAGLDVAPVPGAEVSAHWGACLLRPAGRSFLVVAVYLRDGQGLSAENREILRAISSLVNAVRVPYVLLGDWTMPPSELCDGGWPAHIRGHTVTVGDAKATCTGGRGMCLDYAVIDDRLRDMVSLAFDLDSPFTPHAGLVATLDVSQTWREVQVLRQPRALDSAKDGSYEEHEWESIYRR